MTFTASTPRSRRDRILDETTITFGVSAAGGDRDSVRAIEGLGIESFWVGGHIAGPRPTPEVVTSMSWIAASVERAVVGSAILQLPLYAPAVVAKQFAELDRFTGGGVVLGVGVGGEHPAEFSAVQVPLEERGARADEAIEVIRKLWTAEAIQHRGPHHPMEAVSIRPRPISEQGPPIVVAGRRRPAMRRAAANDGWMPYLYSPERYRSSVADIQARSHQRRSPFAWMLWIVACIDPDRLRARRAVASLQPGGGSRAEEFADTVGAFGGVGEIIERFCQYVDAGVRHFIVALAGDRRLAQVESLVDDVAPAVDRYHRGGA